MLAVKKYKHFCISIGVASALVMSANAACSATYCVGGEIGLGGIYANYNGGDTAQVHNYGGYANIASRTIYANRIQAFAGIQLGGGISNSSGSLTALPQGAFFLLDITAKLGYNIFTANVPLFVNIFVDGGFIFANPMDRSLLTVGAELEGRIPLGKLSLLYSGGYGWVARGTYRFNDNLNSQVGGYNYAITASLGLSYEISDSTAMYIKAIGKYYDLHASSVVDTNLSFPASHHFTAMLEIGINGVLYGYNRVQ